MSSKYRLITISKIKITVYVGIYGGVERQKKNISSFGRISKSFERISLSFEQIKDSFEKIKDP